MRNIEKTARFTLSVIIVIFGMIWIKNHRLSLFFQDKYLHNKADVFSFLKDGLPITSASEILNRCIEHNNVGVVDVNGLKIDLEIMRVYTFEIDKIISSFEKQIDKEYDICKKMEAKNSAILVGLDESKDSYCMLTMPMDYNTNIIYTGLLDLDDLLSYSKNISKGNQYITDYPDHLNIVSLKSAKCKSYVIKDYNESQYIYYNFDLDQYSEQVKNSIITDFKKLGWEVLEPKDNINNKQTFIASKNDEYCLINITKRYDTGNSEVVKFQ